MKPQSSLANLIPIVIIVGGVMGLAISIPNTLLHLGDSFLSLFSVTQVFWMGVLWVGVGSLLLVWRQSSTRIRMMVAVLIIALGIVGLILAVALGVFNGVVTAGTFTLSDIFWLAVVYIVVGGILLLLFRSDTEVDTTVQAESAEWKSLMAVPKTDSAIFSRSQLPPIPKSEPAPPSVPPPMATPSTTPPPAPMAVPAKVVARQAAVSTHDDLTLLEGIGPKIQEALYAAGITTFAQLAAMTPEAIEQIVKVEAKVRMVGDAATWPKQAQFLIDGDAVGFEAYVKHLIAGREPDEKTS